MRETVSSSRVRHPDGALADRDRGRALPDRGRRGRPRRRSRVDPRDGVVDVVRDPHAAEPHRDRGRAVAERNGVDHPAALGVDARHPPGDFPTQTAPRPTATGLTAENGERRARREAIERSRPGGRVEPDELRSPAVGDPHGAGARRQSRRRCTRRRRRPARPPSSPDRPGSRCRRRGSRPRRASRRRRRRPVRRRSARSRRARSDCGSITASELRGGEPAPRSPPARIAADRRGEQQAAAEGEQHAAAAPVRRSASASPRGGAAIAGSWSRIALLELAAARGRARARARRRASAARPGSSAGRRPGGPSGRGRASAGRAAARASGARRPAPRARATSAAWRPSARSASMRFSSATRRSSSSRPISFWANGS